MKLLLISFVAVAFLLLSGGAGALTADHGAVAMVGGMMLVRHIEDLSLEMESAAYPQRRVLQGNNGGIYNALKANKVACPGDCAAPSGHPYTGHGCQAIYRCH
ncbi:hypothetical protein ABZP36_008605 [Zizania latifolia]